VFEDKPVMIKILDYHNIFESLAEGLMVVDRDFRITAFNPALEQMLEIPASQTLGRNLREIFVEEEILEKTISKTFSSGQSFFIRECSLSKKNKSLLLTSITISPLFDEEGTIRGSIVLVKDLQAFKEIEEDLWQSNKLFSVKTLLQGLSHELKNPLLGIRGAAQLLERELRDSEYREYLQVIIKEVDRLNNIIGNLINLTYLRKPLLEPVNIHKVLERVILLEKQSPLGQKVHFYPEYDPSLPEILVDENLLSQVFINLIKNALEAMPNGGEIQVTTKVLSDYYLARINGMEHQVPLMKIEIRDSGVGIPEDKVQYLFTPFFTTKQRGSGLGLALSQEIIRQHGGRLKIESVEGKGTVATILLPLRQ
jgi:two-component system nitrogen regulation sensor histidine kinase GlnL